MSNFAAIIQNAYQEILERNADTAGLSFYNAEMNAGMSEADLRESLLRSEEYARNNQGFRPMVVGRTFNFDYIGYTSFGLLGRSLEDRIAWVERGIAEGVVVFRVFSDTSFWPSNPLLDRVPKHRAVDSTGRHPSREHVRTVRQTVRQALVPQRAVMEYVILVTQFEELGPLFQRFEATENYVFEVMERFNDLPNTIFELGNEVDIQGKGWEPERVNRVLAEVRRRWPQVIISCSSARQPEPAYGDYIYPEASWGNLHYPRQDFPDLSFGWPRFDGPLVDDEPEFFPRTNIDEYVAHQALVLEQRAFMTAHTEEGFICDPSVQTDLPLLRALAAARSA
jgi:Domain of unknown function (DUF4214)